MKEIYEAPSADVTLGIGGIILESIGDENNPKDKSQGEWDPQ